MKITMTCLHCCGDGKSRGNTLMISCIHCGGTGVLTANIKGDCYNEQTWLKAFQELLD